MPGGMHTHSTTIDMLVAYLKLNGSRKNLRRNENKKENPNRNSSKRDNGNATPNKIYPSPSHKHNGHPMFKAGDTYSFRITDDIYIGKEQIAKELGWFLPGMRTTHKAEKSKICRGDIFFHRVTEEAVRVMTTGKHAHLGDLLGPITVRSLTHGEDSDAYSWLRGKKAGDFEIRLEEYIYVRPSTIYVLNGELSKAPDLRILLDLPLC